MTSKTLWTNQNAIGIFVWLCYINVFNAATIVYLKKTLGALGPERCWVKIIEPLPFAHQSAHFTHLELILLHAMTLLVVQSNTGSKGINLGMLQRWHTPRDHLIRFRYEMMATQLIFKVRNHCKCLQHHSSAIPWENCQHTTFSNLLKTRYGTTVYIYIIKSQAKSLNISTLSCASKNLCFPGIGFSTTCILHPVRCLVPKISAICCIPCCQRSLPQPVKGKRSHQSIDE